MITPFHLTSFLKENYCTIFYLVNLQTLKNNDHYYVKTANFFGRVTDNILQYFCRVKTEKSRENLQCHIISMVRQVHIIDMAR